MVEGTIKFFNEMKHFGFIAGDDGTEYFVHASGLKPGTSIKEGDKVSFNAVKGDKGPKAGDVEKVSASHSGKGHKSEEAEESEEAEQSEENQ